MNEIFITKYLLSPAGLSAIGGEKGVRGKALSSMEDVPESVRPAFHEELVVFLNEGRGQLSVDVNGLIVGVQKK